MKANDFNVFRENLIAVKFNPDDYYMKALYLWRRLTDRQANIIKEDIVKHAMSYSVENGTVKCGSIIIK